MPGIILLYFLHFFEISIFGYFFYVAIYNFILSIFGLLNNRIRAKKSECIKNIVIIIPAYKEDNVILNSVTANLKINYPNNLFSIVVIADSLKKDTVSKLKLFPVVVHEVLFYESTKVKSINAALKTIKDDPDIMIILDADNVVEKDFLGKVNDLFLQGYNIIQGRRLIKNPNNKLAYLDDLSEQINNHISRKGTVNIGGSASIAGSGFAIDFQLGKEIFTSLDSIGGFDKEFELKLLQKGYISQYSEDLIVYDEKVETKQVFKNQRKRWISSQYIILRKYFRSGIRAIFQGNFAFFNSAILRNIQLPRLINLGLFTLIVIGSFLVGDYLLIDFYLWITIYCLFILSIFFAIPKKFYSLELLLSISKLPGIFFTMFLLLFKLRGANKKFIHTPHNSQLTSND